MKPMKKLPEIHKAFNWPFFFENVKISFATPETAETVRNDP